MRACYRIETTLFIGEFSVLGNIKSVDRLNWYFFILDYEGGYYILVVLIGRYIQVDLGPAESITP